MKLIAEDLITSIKLRSMAPISQNTFDTPALLQIANEEMATKVVPAIMSVRENFYLTYKLIALTADLERYVIPERASGNALKDLWYADSTQKRQYRISQTLVPNLNANVGTSSSPNEVLFVGDEIMVFPKPSVSQGYLESWFHRKPNQITQTENCAKIQSISSLSGTITFTVDTDLTASLSVGSTVDIVSSKSPFLLWAEEVTITAITSTTIDVATTDVSNEVGSVEPRVNDYICLSRTTNIPMLPEEWHPILAQVSAIRIVRSLGDHNKANALTAELRDELFPNCIKLITNRMESSAPPIIQSQGILDAMGSLGLVNV